jgi:hypothetical protein
MSGRTPLIAVLIVFVLLGGVTVQAYYQLKIDHQSHIKQLKDQEFEHVYGFQLPDTTKEKWEVMHQVTLRLQELQRDIEKAKKEFDDWPVATVKNRDVPLDEREVNWEKEKLRWRAIYAQNRYDNAKKIAASFGLDANSR